MAGRVADGYFHFGARGVGGVGSGVTFVELHPFGRRVADLLDETRLIALQVELIQRPEAGAVIRGGGGLRKIRWAFIGRGKSGGVRVIYYWQTARGKIYLADIYAKNEKEDLSEKELAELRKLIENETDTPERTQSGTGGHLAG